MQDRCAVRLALGVLFLVVTLALASPARAGSVNVVFLDDANTRPLSQRLRAEVETAPGAARTGGNGFVTVRIANGKDRPHAVQVRLESDASDGPIRIRGSVRVSANGAAWLSLPLPALQHVTLRLGFVVDGHDRGTTQFVASTSSQIVGVLGVHDPEVKAPDAVWRPLVDEGVDPALRGSLGRSSPLLGIEPWISTAWLPSDPVLLTAFDLILIATRPDDLTTAQQQALVDYVQMGGNLLLSDVAAGATGPLGALLETRDRSSFWKGRRGLGTFAGVSGEIPAEGREKRALLAWLGEHPLARLDAGLHPLGTGIPTSFWWPLAIPGLGEVPTKIFFLLILLFALVAGPVSYIVFKRRRALAWLVVWIPALGFLGALAVLTYGFLSEGLGQRGAIRSLTFLDQETHEACTVAGRTIYAGISPSYLQPDPGTFLSPFAFNAMGLTPEFDLDLDAGGRIGGAIVPSRTPTSLLTTQVGTARERLRFRRLEDGAFEILHGPGFAPLDEVASVVLRTKDGRLYVRDETGRLARVDGEATRRRWSALTALTGMTPGRIPLSTRRRGRVYYSYRSSDPSNAYWARWAARMADEDLRPAAFVATFQRIVSDLFPGGLPRGTYLARVAAVPSLDDLGLDVDYEAREHVVIGHLADEDFVE